jgi:preprotein translocase subunit SecD
MQFRLIWLGLLSIIILAGSAGAFVIPNAWGKKLGSVVKRIDFRLGLDLSGGAQLIYELDTAKLKEEDKNEAVDRVVLVIERRINALGVTEPTIQGTNFGGRPAVIVELPGVTDLREATTLIGKTAQLEFGEIINEELKLTGLTGAYLDRASVQITRTQQALPNQPEVALTFNSEGAKLFEEITGRNVGQPLAIILDGEVINAPTVQEKISGGKAVITGLEDIKRAKELSIQLNAGALPVPINLIEQRTIGPSLGKQSLVQSLIAGLVGLALVVIFMIVYYRLPGLVAVLALVIYTLLTLSIFKLIPVTLTLAGVAGYILSIGMAVDANILIFERMKEETRKGGPINQVVNDGFARAWSSIRDSNISSLITAVILYMGTTGLVRGFAITLALGILISMFTAITVTKTFLKIALRAT